MKQTYFKKLRGTQRENALVKITEANHAHNFVPLYSLAAIKKAISDPEQLYDPDQDFRFYIEGEKIRIEGKYVTFF